MAPVISISNLGKRFGSTLALDHFDLTVDRGEVHGFLGPNGAGKSTTIRILLGLLRRDSGSVELLGGDPWDDAVELHRRLAYVPDDVRLWPNLTGGEVIDLFGALRGRMDRPRREEMIERLRLDPTKKCGTYSRGNRQKVALISAFASDVELYLMDEPTTGLDPLMVTVFRECVQEAREAGSTVLLSSHIFADVEALCDRVTIIRDGHTVESGTLRQLRHLTRTAISVETERPVEGLGSLSGVHALRQEGAHTELQVEADALDSVVGHIHRFGILSLTSAPPTLEELFMRHYGAGDAPHTSDGAREEEPEPVEERRR
jgi:ABC-2 type transport system ATP-binding protein